MGISQNMRMSLKLAQSAETSANRPHGDDSLSPGALFDVLVTLKITESATRSAPALLLHILGSARLFVISKRGL